MKKIIITSIAVFLTTFCSLNAASQDSSSQTATSSAKTTGKKGIPITAKVLTVDLEEVYNRYNKAIEAKEKFEQAADNAQKEMNEMIQEGIKLGEEYKDLQAKANNPALTEEAKKKFTEEANTKVKAIEDKQNQVAQYQQQAAQTLAQRRQSIMNLHLSDMKEEFAKIAKEKGANLVLNTSGVAVMYHDGSADISEESVETLNATK